MGAHNRRLFVRRIIHRDGRCRLPNRGRAKMRTMRRKLLLVALVGLTAMGGSVRASRAAEDGDEVERPEPVRKIKVLENPYDIAPFYRSSQDEGYGYWAPEPGYAPSGYFGEPGGSGRYPIASYYRNDLSPG